MIANRLMSVSDINVYMTCIFVYQCLSETILDIFRDFYFTNRNVHSRETRQADALRAPYGRLDIRQNSMIIHVANIWNTIPLYSEMSQSIALFKRRLRNHLIDRKTFR